MPCVRRLRILIFFAKSVPESLATLVLPHSIITQDPFAILHSLPQFTALVLLGYSYVGKRQNAAQTASPTFKFYSEDGGLGSVFVSLLSL
ncbi:hypothetical protein AMTR_s00010p00268320 [Amborella trichopoda]|uniref:Uncharacterized protein n=1 Tax=Amborella trichopoda TaxID=13333 RepID=W1NHB7_AMBTC|nr:hypothetical protein AMTR_s00010p00268320 [Amborella trichopoda]